MVKQIVLVGILVASSTAYAQPSPPQSLDKWLAELVTKPTESEKRFATCDAVILPSGELRKPCKLSVTDLAGTDKNVALKTSKLATKRIPKSMLSWTETDVEVRVANKLVATFHVYELASAETSGAVMLQFWAKLVKDPDAIALAKAGKLKAPTKLATGRSPEPKGLSAQDKNDREQALEHLEGHASTTGDLKQLLAGYAEQGAIVVGSAPNQRLTGKAGAKTIRGWKLELKLDGNSASGGTAMVQWAYTRALATHSMKDKTSVTVPYNTLLVQITRITGGGSPAPFPALVLFSVPHG